MASIPANPPPADIFDASAWLAAWTENGGIYILTGDHLHLRRARPLDRLAMSNLDRLRDVMLRAGGGPAIADAVIRRQNGDVP
jgi:hypothetical protein